MALTGLQINKLLPGTNCKECGSNTCLAFAMKLAARKAELSECPYASEEAHRVLGEATEPPVRSVPFGPHKSLIAGEETVLYRHEKTFVRPTILALHIFEEDDDAAFKQKLQAAITYSYERVGEVFHIDCVALSCSKNIDQFISRAEKIWTQREKPLIVKCDNTEAIKRVAEKIAGSGSIICCNEKNCDEIIEIANEHDFAIALTAESYDALFNKAKELREKGFMRLFLQFPTHSLSEQFQVNAIARSAAIRSGIKPLGFPFMRFIATGDMLENAVEAVTEILKYGGIIVLPEFDPAFLASLLTLRLNIFTNPQKPIQVEPNIYSIGEPNRNSPVFVTTNFSLTYFVVSGEIENSGTSAYLVVPECEGMSVLTAWAAGKFNSAKIAGFIKEKNVADLLDTKRLVIPGYVAQLSGELAEELPGWEIIVGPQDASDIENFVKARL